MMIEHRAALTGAVDFQRRTIELVAVPYNEETVVEYRGRLMREIYEPGAMRDIDPTKTNITLNRDHTHERVVGKVIELRDTPTGAVALAKVSKTPLGDETLQLADDKILGASIGVAVSQSGMEIRGDLRRVFRAAYLDHIAMLPNPAYAGAKVLAVRSANHAEDELEDEPIKPNLTSVLALAGIDDLIRGRYTNRR